MMGFGTPLRMEGIEGVREEGKEDKDACRVRFVLALAVVPLVEGRYERTDAILLVTTSSVSRESVTRSHQSALLKGFIGYLCPLISQGKETFSPALGHSCQMLIFQFEAITSTGNYVMISEELREQMKDVLVQYFLPSHILTPI